jgi:hypothetical protein
MGNFNSTASSEVVLEERPAVSFAKLLEAPSLVSLYASTSPSAHVCAVLGCQQLAML